MDDLLFSILSGNNHEDNHESDLSLVPPLQKDCAVPGMTLEMERKCIAEIKDMGDQVASWKRLQNGMTAGEFAFIYVMHFRERQNHRWKWKRGTSAPLEPLKGALVPL
jgi:hypothetical protein